MIGESRIIGRLCRLRADRTPVVAVAVHRDGRVLRSDDDVQVLFEDDLVDVGALDGATTAGFMPSVTGQLPARDLIRF